MRIPINDLSRLDRKETQSLSKIFTEVIQSGKFLNSIQNEIFTKKLAEYVGVMHAVGLASGTDALKIALISLGCKSKSKVIVTANSGGYATTAAASLDCEVLFADINVDDATMSVASLEKLIDHSVSAVVVTHLYGNPAKIDEILRICNKFNVPLIEDCAQAIGGMYAGKKLGSFGLMSTFSFYPTKNLGALGDGGAICTNDSEIAWAIKSISQYGWSKKKYEIEFEGGTNSRLDEMQAAVLNHRFPSLDTSNELRKNIIERYTNSLANKETKIITKYKDGGVCHLAILVISDGMTRSGIQSKMKELQIETAIHYPVLDIDQTGFKQKIFNVYDLTNSYSITDKLLTLPCFPQMYESEINYVCDVLEKYFE
jgi:dTDP-4-amino-4,6-dideoxygalactose transaminase